jgi:hypothetical protein
VEQKLAFRDILTPEQLEKFQGLRKEQMRKGMKERVKKRIFFKSEEPKPPQMGWREDSVLDEEFVPGEEAPIPLEEEAEEFN